MITSPYSGFAGEPATRILAGDPVKIYVRSPFLLPGMKALLPLLSVFLLTCPSSGTFLPFSFFDKVF
jgi:hypothetical protein